MLERLDAGGGPMLDRTQTVKKVHESSGTSAAASDQAWVGFICKGCGAPLAVHQSNNGSRPGERSIRGWRVMCTSCGVPDFYELGSAMVRITAVP
jgi:RNase P subunit RPR2